MEDRYEYSQLSEGERRFLSALPYRVGLWVSQSDTSGGDESDTSEKAALEIIIAAYTQDMCKSEFIQRIMNETMARRKEWPSWALHLEEVPAECERAVNMLRGRMTGKELSWLCSNLMEIAENVAMAFREIDENQPSVTERLMRGLDYLVEKLVAAIRKQTDSYNEYASISAKEKTALRELAKRLRVQH